MADRYQKGQIVMEAVIVILFLLTVFLMIAGHMKAVKKSFDKKDLTSEVKNGNKSFF
jgi:hypothetical protein